MRHQGGWAASFFIIGTVLVLGLIGGVYVLKQQSNKPTEAPVAVTAPEKSSEDNQATQPVKPEQNTEQAQKPDEQSPAATTSQSPAAPSSTGRLPETGPTDTLGKMIAVTALTVAVVCYFQSRRKSFSL